MAWSRVRAPADPNRRGILRDAQPWSASRQDRSAGRARHVSPSNPPRPPSEQAYVRRVGAHLNRNADLDDCVASKQMLIDTGWVDPDRIGIIGGSYGGYMVLAAMTFRPETFAVGADYFGISNWYRTVNSMPVWWTAQRDALEQEMGEFDDEEFFKAKSPLFHAEQIVRPLIVLQGANDPRVLQIESDQIVEAVRANGVPVDYVLFDDEGHGFVKKENQAEAARRVLAFLDEHLGTAP